MPVIVHRHLRWALLGFVLLGEIAVTRNAVAGAWLQPPEGVYLKTSWMWWNTSHGLDCRGQTREVDSFGGRYEVRQFFGYFEYGAREWLTVLGGWAYKDQRIRGARIPDYGTRSTGDLRLGGRLPLRRGVLPVSFEVVGSLPTYGATDLSAPVAEREQYLPAGSGKPEVEAGLQAGLSLYPLPLYSNLAAMRRWRGGDFGDQWLLRAEVGASTSRIFVKVEIDWTLPEADPCGSATVGNVSVQEKVVRLAPEIGVRAWGDLWLNAGLASVLSGRNSLDGRQGSLGVAWIRR
jgi:hypothetical protein